jgi:hypothetical protein
MTVSGFMIGTSWLIHWKLAFAVVEGILSGFSPLYKGTSHAKAALR